MNFFLPLAFISSSFSRAMAYLDPGSGSFILQILLAALLGGLFIIKSYWRRITGFFARLRARSRFSSRKEDRQE